MWPSCIQPSDFPEVFPGFVTRLTRKQGGAFVKSLNLQAPKAEMQVNRLQGQKVTTVIVESEFLRITGHRASIKLHLTSL